MRLLDTAINMGLASTFGSIPIDTAPQPPQPAKFADSDASEPAPRKYARSIEAAAGLAGADLWLPGTPVTAAIADPSSAYVNLDEHMLLWTGAAAMLGRGIAEATKAAGASRVGSDSFW